MIKSLFVLLCLLAVSACSFFYGEDGLIKDTSYQYVESEQSSDITLPDGLQHNNKIDYAQVPSIGEKAEISQAGKELITTPPVEILDVSDKVRVDRKSTNPAVFIQESKPFLWRVLVDFLESREVSPKKLDEENSFVDTGWVSQEKGSVWNGIESEQNIDGYRTQYHFHITSVKSPTLFRLEVARAIAQVLDEESGQWQKDDTLHQDATHMMNMFLAFYDRKITERRIEETKLASDFDVSLGKDKDSHAALVTEAKKKVVWQQLPNIFKEINIEVDDIDRASNTYFLKYEKEEPGFFASLLSEERRGLPLDTGDYQASLGSLGDLTTITFKNAQGEPLSDAIMAKIYPFLSTYFGKNSN